jgi:hypothetical protein
LTAAGAEVIEAGGMTLMPGLGEGHAHLSFGNAVATTQPGRSASGGAQLLTARNAKTLLDHGFTSAYSAASVRCTTLYTIGPFILFDLFSDSVDPARFVLAIQSHIERPPIEVGWP